MAYASNGGAITLSGVAQNIVDALSGIANPPFKSPNDKGPRAHVDYHVLSFRADAANSGTAYLGHTSLLLTTGVNRVGFLAKGDQFTEDLSQGVGAVESWWVIGTSNDTIYVHWTE